MDNVTTNSIAESLKERLPAKLLNFLLPFQRDGVEFAISKNGRCLIADEMGLGKTLQALSVAMYYRTEWPLLIVVPSSLKFCWIEELEKWMPEILPQHINLVQCGSDASGVADSPITIITYGLLRLPSSKLIREAIKARKFQVVICDESHYLKNGRTLSSQTVVPLIKTAQRRILLSGTPALAKPVELYPQIDAICPGKFGSFWKFTDRYCDAHNVYYGKVTRRNVDGASNLEELQQRLQSMLMIRREKSSVLTQLPPKQRQRVLFELKQSSLRTEINDRFADLKGKLMKGNKTVRQVLQGTGPDPAPAPTEDGQSGPSEDAQDISVLTQISKLYQLSGEAKLGPVREYIEMLCENSELKFLVFAYHHNMMDGVQQTLWEKKVKFVRIDGLTKGIDRQAYVNQFQSDPEIRVAILSILAAGVGLTFTAAKLVVFAELYWTPGVMLQCEDRAHRIGQTCSLPVHYLVAKGTMDEWVWSAVCKKTMVTSTALSGKTKNLEHAEGERYQIDLLSNAEMWKPVDNADGSLDISNLIDTQRLPDQPSILSFFNSPRTSKLKDLDVDEQSVIDQEHTEDKGTHKIKEDSISSIFKLLEKYSSKGKEKECDTSKDRKRKLDEIIVLSSDGEEDDFRSPGIKKKKKKSKLGLGDKMSEEIPQKENTNKPKVKEVVSYSDFLLKSFDDSVEAKAVEDSSDDSLPDFDFLRSGKTSSVGGKELNVEDVSDTHGERRIETDCDDVQGIKFKSNQDLGEKLDDLFNLGNEDETGMNSRVEKLLGSCEKMSKLEMDESLSESVTTNENSVEKKEAAYGSPCVKQSNEDDHAFVKLKSQNGEDATEQSQWSCGMCTFLNHSAIKSCEMCETPRKRKREKSGGKNRASKKSLYVAASEEQSQKTGEHLHEEDNLKKGQDALHVSYDCDKSLTVVRKSNVNHKLTPVLSESESTNCDEEGVEIDPVASPEQGSRCGTPSLFDDSDDDMNIDESSSPSNEELSKGVKNDCQNSAINPSDSPVHAQEDEDSLESFLSALPENALLESSNQPEDKHLETSSDSLNGTRKSKSTTSDLPLQNKAVDADCLPSVQSRSTSDVPSVSSVNFTVHRLLKFSCSSYTGRIYVFDEEGNPLEANFLPLDLEVGNISCLPEVLQHPSHLQLLTRFLREWSSLTDTKRRLIAKRNLVFTSPLMAYEDVKSLHGSKQRHLTKTDTVAAATKKASEIDGSIRLITKKSGPEVTTGEETSSRGLAQVVTKDGTPLCLQCEKPYANSLFKSQTISNSKNAWQLRFCSADCMDKYWTLTKASYCRDQLFSLQHGVCQLCQTDAHDLFNRIRIIKDLSVRADMLNKSTFNKLSKKQRQKMVTQPAAGQFWHVDHIIPVWQGGGMCDLDNLRTLCTPCHMALTSTQASQRATMKKLAGATKSHNITAFFQRS